MASRLPLRDPIDDVRIRRGQRSLIMCTVRRLGLRDEQLHDLVESISEYRTRAISQLTLAQARRLIGLLKTMEREAARRAAGGPAPAPVTSDDLVKRAARRAGSA